MRVPIQRLISALFLLIPVVVLGASLEKGLAAYNGGDYETAMAECLPLAEAGNVDAQFCVGRMYANGFGVTMDDAQAIHWYSLAADAGHAEAQYNLAVMYANGWGVEMDDVIAAKYYRLSAEQGYLQAMCSLAYVTYRGIGVPEDLVEGYMWYDVSAKLGELAAVQRRDDLAKRMSDDDLLRAQDMALRWLDGYEGKALHAGTVEP
jgi:TPR repeat protein